MYSNWSYSPETPNLGQIRRFLDPCDLEIWRMTLKNNKAPLLSNIKLYASFYLHMWIQTGVTVRKGLSWVVTLTFDLWPWPFASTLPWSLVIIPENFMMMQWWEHSQKGVTDGQTHRRTENTIHRAAWSQLKIALLSYCHISQGPMSDHETKPHLFQVKHSNAISIRTQRHRFYFDDRDAIFDDERPLVKH